MGCNFLTITENSEMFGGAPLFMGMEKRREGWSDRITGSFDDPVLPVREDRNKKGSRVGASFLRVER
jgi:hypothetical protein